MKLAHFFFPLFPVVLFALLFAAPPEAEAHDHANHEASSLIATDTPSKRCSVAADDANPTGKCCKSLEVAQAKSNAHAETSSHCGEECECEATCACHEGGECPSGCKACDHGKHERHQAKTDIAKSPLASRKDAGLQPKAASLSPADAASLPR